MKSPKVRLYWLAIACVCLVGFSTSNVASARNLGPFWHVNGAKLGQGVSKAVIGELTQPYSGALYAEAGNKKIIVTCEKDAVTGKIWNGTQHGEGEGKGSASGKCKVFEIVGSSVIEIKECRPKEPLTAEAKASLWFETRGTGTSTERTSKIVGIGFPGSGVIFGKQVIEGAGCGVLEGIYSVEGTAAGTFVNGEGAEVATMKVSAPTEQIKHIWLPTSQQLIESQPELKFNAKPATAVGEAKIELSSKENFGVFTE